jgi:spore coat polysaccharide biosynthesis protein SpsF
MIYCFIQARYNSQRLPGKVLLPLCGKPVLKHIVERLKFSKKIDKIIVVTSINPENDAIESLCRQMQVDCFRGSEDDVLDRFKGTIKVFDIQDNDSIIRITGDCPLISPGIIDVIASVHRDNDLTTNCIQRTFPDGLDVECFKTSMLFSPMFRKVNPFELEYDIKNFDGTGFRVTNIIQERDMSKLRWTLDTQGDYEFITKVYEALYKPGQIFLMEDILKWLAKQS